MAVEMVKTGTPAQCNAAVNTMADAGTFPGGAAQLARVQAAALAEIAAYPTAKMLSVTVQCHRDNGSSRFHIYVQPVRATAAGIVQSTFSDLGV